MKQLISITCIFLILFATGLVDGQALDASAAPSPAPPDCTDVIFDMLNCVSYLSPDSGDNEPSDTCCDALPLVLAVDKTCLCVAIRESIDIGVVFNFTRVESLPYICNVALPPLSSCGLNLSPTFPASSAIANPPDLAAAAYAPVNHHGNGINLPAYAPVNHHGNDIDPPAYAPVNHHGNVINPPAPLVSKSPPPKQSTRSTRTRAATPSPAPGPMKAAASPILGFISINLLFASFFCYMLL